MSDVGAIPQGALAITNGQITAVGPTPDILDRYSAEHYFDAQGQAIVPGFVDPHTHTVFGGDRVHEFELRIQGASYMEIMAAGGGIVSTMRHTREAIDFSVGTCPGSTLNARMPSSRCSTSSSGATRSNADLVIA